MHWNILQMTQTVAFLKWNECFIMIKLNNDLLDIGEEEAFLEEKRSCERVTSSLHMKF